MRNKEYLRKKYENFLESKRHFHVNYPDDIDLELISDAESNSESDGESNSSMYEL